jgi:hypothetical protein
MTAGIVALVLSAAALGISTWLAIRQARQQKKAAYLGMLSEFRSREFNARYLYVWRNFRRITIPTQIFPGDALTNE